MPLATPRRHRSIPLPLQTRKYVKTFFCVQHPSSSCEAAMKRSFSKITVFFWGGGGYRRRISKLDICWEHLHYRRQPALLRTLPNGFTNTIAGSLHYSIGTIEGPVPQKKKNQRNSDLFGVSLRPNKCTLSTMPRQGCSIF